MTDLPEPVVPAIRPWGPWYLSEMSSTKGWDPAR